MFEFRLRLAVQLVVQLVVQLAEQLDVQLAAERGALYAASYAGDLVEVRCWLCAVAFLSLRRPHQLRINQNSATAQNRSVRRRAA